MKKQVSEVNVVTKSDLYNIEGLLKTLGSSDTVVCVDRAFCVLVSLNSYGLAGNRKKTIDRLDAALKRLGNRATPRMLKAFVAHVGRAVAHPSIIRLLEETERAQVHAEAVSNGSLPQATPVAAAPAPAPAKKPQKPKTKKARKAAQAAPPPAKARTCLRLGDPEAEAAMRERCVAPREDLPAFVTGGDVVEMSKPKAKKPPAKARAKKAPTAKAA